MKNYFPSKTVTALAVAIAVAAGYENLVNAQPIPPPATAGALPAGIQPGTPVAEVIKLAQAGVDAGVIQNYISNCPSAFNVNADEIIALTDAGVSSDMVNAMIVHDKAFLAALPTSTPPAPSNVPPPTQVAGADYSAPPAPVTQADFDNSLSPYGQWVQVEGYGRCWRPTAVVYDATWQPYCDRGRWVYTDCGWYWDSDYSWGVTFHYGRWFNTPSYGWCWWPDTVWAPSWVTWRSGGDYCGWAPLPPFAVYQPGIGFTYRGANVAVSFGFGLSASCFTFVSVGNFCQPHPRYYCAPHQQVTQIYNQTTIINNYNYNSHNRTVVNNGVSVTAIGTAAHRSIQPVSVNMLASSRNHGWPAGNPNHNPNRYGTGSPASPTTSGAGNNNSLNNHVPPQHKGNGGENNNYYHQNSGGGGTGHRPPFSQPAQPVNRATESAPAGHSQNYGTPSNQQNQPNQHQPGWFGRNNSSVPVQNFQPFAADHPRNNGLASENNRFASRPAAPVPAANVAPVASSHSQSSEARQNYNQLAPRYVAPAASAVSSPAQNQPANAGGRSQGWMTQNH